MIIELKPIYDSRTIFYNKANVKTEGGVKTLYSYNVEVAKIEEYNNKKKLYINGWFSSTTARHINDFIQQNGFNWMSKKEMEKYKND